jgi:phage-related protein
VLNLVRVEARVPEKFLKHLTDTDGLYELRVKSGSNIFRIFCFFDAGQLVVLLTGFQKKTDKTPRNELQKALALKAEYFQQKPKLSR